MEELNIRWLRNNAGNARKRSIYDYPLGENQVAKDIKQQFNEILKYFQEEEAEQKRRYYGAIDIEDMDEATAVTLDARLKIQQLRKWIEDLQRVSAEVEGVFPESFMSTDKQKAEIEEETILSQHEDDIRPNAAENSEKIQSVGEYVKQKMYQLSRKGYVFTDKQLCEIQDADWSRRILNIRYPFARIYNASEDLAKQTSIHNIPGRYWSEDIQFGHVSLLVYTGWAPMHKPFFDAWYESLETVSNVLEQAERMTDKEDNAEKPESHKAGKETINVTNTSMPVQLKGFHLFGKHYDAECWQDILIRLCEVMILKKPYKMARLGAKDQYEVSGEPILSLDEQQIQINKKLSNGFYVDINGASEDLRRRCEYILSECGFSNNVLQIS